MFAPVDETHAGSFDDDSTPPDAKREPPVEGGSLLAKDCYSDKMRVIVEFYSLIIQRPE